MPIWFPSSAWEPTSAKLCFAIREAELQNEVKRLDGSDKQRYTTTEVLVQLEKL